MGTPIMNVRTLDPNEREACFLVWHLKKKNLASAQPQIYGSVWPQHPQKNCWKGGGTSDSSSNTFCPCDVVNLYAFILLLCSYIFSLAIAGECCSWTEQLLLLLLRRQVSYNTDLNFLYCKGSFNIFKNVQNIRPGWGIWPKYNFLKWKNVGLTVLV